MSLLADGPEAAPFDPDEWPMPEHWSDAARDAALGVLEERGGLSGSELAQLTQAAELISTADLMMLVAAQADYMSEGSRGQPVLHDGVSEARQARQSAAQILARLAPLSAAQARKVANLKQGNVRGPQ